MVRKGGVPWNKGMKGQYRSGRSWNKGLKGDPRCHNGPGGHRFQTGNIPWSKGKSDERFSAKPETLKKIRDSNRNRWANMSSAEREKVIARLKAGKEKRQHNKGELEKRRLAGIMKSAYQTNYLKSVAISYFRYTKHCFLMGLEVSAKLSPTTKTGDRADVLILTPNNLLVEIEVKVSLTDLRSDARKEIHEDMKKSSYRKYPVHFFYFLVPPEIEQEALEIIKARYPEAGLFGVRPHPRRGYPILQVLKIAKKSNAAPVGEGQRKEMMLGMTSTLIRLYKRAIDLGLDVETILAETSMPEEDLEDGSDNRLEEG